MENNIYFCRRIWRIIYGLLGITLVSALACHHGDRTTSALRSEPHDSAGIRIVENSRPPDGSRLGWRIGPEPAVSIGKREGEVPYLFASATDATILRDGRIVVVDMASDELRVFDALGSHLATWGGQGEGPGEFIDLYHVDRWPGDSVAAGDYRRESITVFDSDGKFGRIVRLESDPSPWDLRAFFALGLYMVTGEGSVLVSRQPHGSDEVDIAILDGDGIRRGSLGRHPGWPSLVQRGMVLYQPIFSRSLAVEPWAELVVIAPTDRSEIRAFTHTGTLARIVRLGQEPRAPERAHIDAYIEAQVSRVSSEDADHRARLRRDYNSVPVAERLPVFTSVISDALDHLWVEEYEVPGEERDGVLWTVVDPGGRVLGFVETPEGLEVYEIGDDFILGRVKDELGVEYIQVWPLERSGVTETEREGG